MGKPKEMKQVASLAVGMGIGILLYAVFLKTQESKNENQVTSLENKLEKKMTKLEDLATEPTRIEKGA